MKKRTLESIFGNNPAIIAGARRIAKEIIEDNGYSTPEDLLNIYTVSDAAWQETWELYAEDSEQSYADVYNTIDFLRNNGWIVNSTLKDIVSIVFQEKL